MELTINPEFHNLIPSISPEEYQLLEESILNEGCREAIVTWNDIILDGHNRYEICQKHNIGLSTLEKEFDNEVEAKIWIIRNQLARRNLSSYERVRLALLLKPAIEEKAKAKQIQSGGSVPQKSAKPPIDTREEVAKAAGLSHDTVSKVNTIEAEGSPEVKEAVSKGEMSINEGYQKTVLKKKPKPKKKIPKAKPLVVDQVNNEIKKTFEAFYEAVRKARKNQWKDSPKKAIEELITILKGLLI